MRAKRKTTDKNTERLLDLVNRASVFVLLVSLAAVWCITSVRATGTVVPTMEFFDGHATVRFIDVGQGDCTLVTHRGHAVLIDTGPTDEARATAEYVRLYAPKLDAVIITHPHSDHMGGAAQVLSRCRASALILGDEESTEAFYSSALDAAQKRGCAVVLLTGGASYRFGDIDVAIFDTSGYDHEGNLNDASLAVRIDVDGLSLLAAGDAEAGEEAYLAGMGCDLDVDYLQINHHGSSTSSTEAYLAAVTPEVAVISVGRGNSYGHPSMAVLESLEEAGAEIRRTDREGTIVIRGRG